jgi:hypothetical protein
MCNQRETTVAGAHNVATVAWRAAERVAQGTDAGAQPPIGVDALRPDAPTQLAAWHHLAVPADEAQQEGEVCRLEHERARRTGDASVAGLDPTLAEPEFLLMSGGFHDPWLFRFSASIPEQTAC